MSTTTHMSLARQVEQQEQERAEWLRVLSDKGPQPHHNTQTRDLQSFTERQRNRMKAAGWWPIKQRGEARLDVLLAVAIGLVFAGLLFIWLSA